MAGHLLKKQPVENNYTDKGGTSWI